MPQTLQSTSPRVSGDENKGDSVWTLIQSTGRPFSFVENPRKDPDGLKLGGELIIRLVTLEDQTHAAMEADRWAQKATKSEGGQAYDEIYSADKTLQIIQRAVYSAEDYRRDGSWRLAFPPVMLLRGKMLKSELDYFASAYNALQSLKGAVKEDIEEDTEDIWAQMLVADPVQTLSMLSESGLVSLLMAFAKRIAE